MSKHTFGFDCTPSVVKTINFPPSISCQELPSFCFLNWVASASSSDFLFTKKWLRLVCFPTMSEQVGWILSYFGMGSNCTLYKYCPSSNSKTSPCFNCVEWFLSNTSSPALDLFWPTSFTDNSAVSQSANSSTKGNRIIVSITHVNTIE